MHVYNFITLNGKAIYGIGSSKFHNIKILMERNIWNMNLSILNEMDSIYLVIRI